MRVRDARLAILDRMNSSDGLAHCSTSLWLGTTGRDGAPYRQPEGHPGRTELDISARSIDSYRGVPVESPMRVRDARLAILDRMNSSDGLAHCSTSLWLGTTGRDGAPYRQPEATQGARNSIISARSIDSYRGGTG